LASSKVLKRKDGTSLCPVSRVKNREKHISLLGVLKERLAKDEKRQPEKEGNAN